MGIFMVHGNAAPIQCFRKGGKHRRHSDQSDDLKKWFNFTDDQEEICLFFFFSSVTRWNGGTIWSSIKENIHSGIISANGEAMGNIACAVKMLGGHEFLYIKAERQWSGTSNQSALTCWGGLGDKLCATVAALSGSRQRTLFVIALAATFFLFVFFFTQIYLCLHYDWLREGNCTQVIINVWYDNVKHHHET